MKKVLIIQTAFIGDVILATSLIESVKKQLPDAQIDFLLRSGNQSLLENNPHIKNVIIWEKNKNKLKSLWNCLKFVRNQKYDLVLNIQRFFNSGLLTAFSGAKVKIGFDKNPLSFLFSKKVIHKIPHTTETGHLHEVQRNIQLLNLINGKEIGSAQRPQLYFNDKDHETINNLNLPQKYIVMAPSSVWYTKQWHEDKWKELIAEIPKDYKIYLIGAPSDQTYIDKLKTDLAESLCGKLNLRESALLMQNAARVFVNDSAPLHLASSVNAKTTAIFCSTVPEFGYTPLSEDSVTIQLNPRLECMPCGLHGKSSCPLGHFKCAKDISTRIVLETI